MASSKTKVSTLERQAAKLDSDDIRNPDPRGVTSLALAAAAGNVEVCEWLIFDEQHEEGQISRVRDRFARSSAKDQADRCCTCRTRLERPWCTS